MGALEEELGERGERGEREERGERREERERERCVGGRGSDHTLHDPLPGHILALLDQQEERRGRIEIEERD